MIDSSKKLNSEQIEAIEHGDGPLLIIAGAGTGKTTVVTERIKYLIAEKGVSPSNILALTFTEKAAREMEERVDIALPLSYSNLWISTFHSFCDRILRDEAINIGLNPGYRLMSQAENIYFLKKNIFKFDLEYFRPLGNPHKFVEGMFQHFSRLKDEDVEPEEYLEWVLNQKLRGKNQDEKAEKDDDEEEILKYDELAKAYKTYEELKIKEGVMDFGDLLSNTLKIFRKRPSILKKYRQMFKYILVDEFQDTNFAQYILIKFLAPPPNANLTVVGDDNQAIYRFRGAAVSNILQFKDDYPVAKSVILNKNYRSSQNILDSSYRLIKYNDPDTLEAKLGINKKLIKMRDGEETPVEFLMAGRVEDEAEMVINEIENLKSKNKDYSWRDFAILVRANNHAEPFIQAFQRVGIPCQFLGPGMLFRQPEIKDLIAYLSILYNFEDDLSMYRVLTMECFKISGRDLAELLNLSRKYHLSLFEICEEAAGVRKHIGEAKNLEGLENKTKETLSKLIKMVHKHLDEAKTEKAGKILYSFLEETGTLKSLMNYENEGDERKAQNVAKFFEKLKQYETEREDASVSAVVDFINFSLELGESPLVNDLDWTENDAVNLLTVHSAKGLEFPVVFLVNLVSQRFPAIERKEQIPIPKELIKEMLPEGDFHLEEERRLFYVGMTRAKDKLFLTAAKFYGDSKREKRISQFVKEALGELKIKNYEPKIENQLSIFDYNNKPLKETLAVKTNLKNLSYSQIETFKTCPLKYKYRYVLNIPVSPSAALSFGSVIHETMKVFYKRAIAGQNPTKNDILKIFDENWIATGYSSKEQREKYKKEGQKILSEFYEKAYDPQIMPLALEQNFSIKISSGLKITGKIDRLDSKDNEVEIIDYKTGKSSTQKEADKDLQLAIYALAVASGQFTDLGILKKTPKPQEIKLSFYFFDDQVKVSSFRTDKDLENVREEILDLAEKILKSDFSAKPGMACEYCEYKIICDKWKSR